MRLIAPALAPPPEKPPLWSLLLVIGPMGRGSPPGYIYTATDIPRRSRAQQAAERHDTWLFHRHRLRQVARLVDVRAHDDGGVIGDELHRHGVDERRHGRRHGRQRECRHGLAL